MHFSLVRLRWIIGRYIIFDLSGYSPLEMFCMKPDQLGLQLELFRKYNDACHKLSTQFVRVPASSFSRHPTLDPACPLPFLKFFLPLPSFLFHPPFKVFLTVPPTLTQFPPALIRPTNLPWFKQISKGRFYQFNCRFLSKSNF